MLLTINQGLKCIAICRQAERSVHFSLGGEDQWRELRSFYNDNAKTVLRRMVAVLNRGHRLKQSPGRETIYSKSMFLYCVYCVYSFLPRIVGRIQLSPREAAFISARLESMLAHLELASPPPQEQLIELRLDLTACWSILAGKLYGSAGLRRALKVRHYGQLASDESIQMDDYLVQGGD